MNTSHIIDGQPLTVNPVTDREQSDKRASSVNGVDELLNFPSQSSPEDHQMLDLAGEDNIQTNLENTDVGREEDEVEHQPNLVSEYQNPVHSMSYHYGEQWGIAEDVTTLDDILSLSW